MNRRTLAIIAAAAVLAAAAWPVLRHDSDSTGAAGTTAAVAGASTVSAESAALAATPQAIAYRERLAFERRIRDFLGNAPRLGAVERSEQARTFALAVDDHERAGQMSAGEAFLLHAALIKAGTADEAESTQRLAHLVERYRADAVQREAAWQSKLQRDPKFRDYQSRERDIVAEVTAMREIPGGLTRDEYLRQRLQHERERAYR